MDDSFSAVAEDLFFSFSAFRPWPKCFFYCFSPVGRGRKSFFGVFGSSATAKTQNLPVFDFPPRLKTNFRRFLVSSMDDERFFAVFCVSLMSEMLFSMFFACRLQAKRCFWQFLHFAHERRMIFCIFGFPRGGKCSLWRFLIFPMLGWPISAVF